VKAAAPSQASPCGFPLGPGEIAERDFVRVIQSMRAVDLPWYAAKFCFDDALELARAVEENRPRDCWLIP
jgi:hypothetical protein